MDHVYRWRTAPGDCGDHPADLGLLDRIFFALLAAVDRPALSVITRAVTYSGVISRHEGSRRFPRDSAENTRFLVQVRRNDTIDARR